MGQLVTAATQHLTPAVMKYKNLEVNFMIVIKYAIVNALVNIDT
jgi:hypothetical protein